jgi:hypothetical protein
VVNKLSTDSRTKALAEEEEEEAAKAQEEEDTDAADATTKNFLHYCKIV